MWFKNSRVFSALIIVSLSYVMPAVLACEKHEKATLILHESGVAKKIHRITWMTETMMNSEFFAQFPAQDILLAREVIRAEMNADALLSAMKNALASSLSLDDMSALLHWFQSDLSKRINEAEDQACAPSSFLNTYNQREQIIADGKERYLTAEIVCDALKADELMVQTQNFMMNVFFVMMGQPETLSSGTSGLGEDEQVRRLAHAAFLQVCHNLTDEEVDAFKDFVLTAPALQMTSIVMQKLAQTLDDTVLAVKHKLHQQRAESPLDNTAGESSLAPNTTPVSCCCG